MWAGLLMTITCLSSYTISSGMSSGFASTGAHPVSSHSTTSPGRNTYDPCVQIKILSPHKHDEEILLRQLATSHKPPQNPRNLNWAKPVSPTKLAPTAT
uniref:Secreted protein n=1 Tax=Physcomitrium patens TaxID=3218 RepID=A0A2K1IQV6_PHYPA|nr:hypothetical protein PHYPA_025780 [Physcomitrium patens]